jgi:hypothetical protein
LSRGAHDFLSVARCGEWCGENGGEGDEETARQVKSVDWADDRVDEWAAGLCGGVEKYWRIS